MHSSLSGYLPSGDAAVDYNIFLWTVWTEEMNDRDKALSTTIESESPRQFDIARLSVAVATTHRLTEA